jgi:hypothetical protein
MVRGQVWRGGEVAEGAREGELGPGSGSSPECSEPNTIKHHHTPALPLITSLLSHFTPSTCLDSISRCTTATSPCTHKVCRCPRPPAPEPPSSAVSTMAASSSPQTQEQPVAPSSPTRSDPVHHPSSALDTDSTSHRTARSCTTLPPRSGAPALVPLPTPSSPPLSSLPTSNCTLYPLDVSPVSPPS